MAKLAKCLTVPYQSSTLNINKNVYFVKLTINLIYKSVNNKLVNIIDN